MTQDAGYRMCRLGKSRILKFRMTPPEHPIFNKEHPTSKSFQSGAE
jgi:hypothetical protein